VTKRIFSLSRLSLLTVVICCSIGPVNGQEIGNQNFNVDRNGVFINGYDVVSYFLDAVTKGKSSLSVNHEGIEYWFNNEENQQIFVKNPEKFIPAYGGWCAYAMGDTGEKVKIDAKTYKIVEGKLYLFYNFYFNNTLIDWNEDEARLKKQADANWLKFTSQ
jgi:YHS domain-containing protein